MNKGDKWNMISDGNKLTASLCSSKFVDDDRRQDLNEQMCKLILINKHFGSCHKDCHLVCACANTEM